MLDNFTGHVDGDEPRSEKSDCTRRLWNDPNGIDNRVTDAKQSGCLEQLHCELGRRIGQHIQESGDYQWQDVFQIIAMRSAMGIELLPCLRLIIRYLDAIPANTFDIVVVMLDRNFEPCGILFVDEGLVLETHETGQHGHAQRFEDKPARPNCIVAKHGIIDRNQLPSRHV